MTKGHVVAAALLIGIGAALGTYALTRTSALGVSARVSSKKAADATVTVQTRRLDAIEKSLRKALARKPPVLPKIPKLRPAPQPRVVYAAAPAPINRVVVRSAAPVRSTRAAAAPASHREQDHESEHSDSGGEHGD